ncbi:hypothetical protein [Actinoplanes siamensis]|uniref:DUF5666 domain-containing protein n=1 Tax=Actinoplanes siamensis TaxID=1223317 RepID=A0A919NA91_9ACTN|nr:hypothetical protein [Actinoplanes siamensis]GIF07393.1 hypothetical protein Asi03nite_49310 [Actinoplanes siamensis]
MNDETKVLPRTPTEAEQEDPTSAGAEAGPRRWWNTTTLVLVGVVLLVGGFVGGAQAQRHWGASGTPTTATPAGGGLPDGAGAPSGPSMGGRSPGGATAGTIRRVDGNIVYVRTAAGETVTVRASDFTTVSRAVPARITELTAGLRITVQGVADSDGVVTATAIVAG